MQRTSSAPWFSMIAPDHKCALRLRDLDEGLLLFIIRLSTEDLRSGACADYKAATAAYTSISLVSRQCAVVLAPHETRKTLLDGIDLFGDWTGRVLLDYFRRA